MRHDVYHIIIQKLKNQMKVQKLEVMINKKGFKLHLHDIRKLSKVLLFKTPKLPKFQEDDQEEDLQ